MKTSAKKNAKTKKNANVKKNTMSGPSLNRSALRHRAWVKEALRMYKRGKKNIAEIAKAVQLNPAYVAMVLRREGVTDLRTRYGQEKRKLDYKEVVRLYKREKWPMRAIADHFNVAVTSVAYALRKQGVDARPRGAKRVI